MELTSFKEEYFPEMAALFVANFKRLRALVPALPDAMENADRICAQLGRLPGGVVALEGGRVVGYLSAFLVDEWRGTEQRAAYCPEWGHAAASPEVYRALYREASARWFESGCATHCISLLAHDHAAEKVWFWNGFGLIVVDAIRSIAALENVASVPARKATLEDVEALAALEAEHAHYYRQPPVLMSAYDPPNADVLAACIDSPQNAIWLTVDGAAPVGFLRLESSSNGAAGIVDAPDKIAITGAYLRPAYRRRGAAKAMLNAAFQDYAARGYARCSVDFESFNPEAAAFWPKYFEPVCLSAVRTPERQPSPSRSAATAAETS